MNDDDDIQIGSPSAALSNAEALALATREEALAKWEALATDATPGPWWPVDYDKGDEFGSSCVMSEHIGVTDGAKGGEVSRADARFISASRTAVPLLIAEVRRLRGEAETKRGRHHFRCERVRRIDLDKPCTCEEQEHWTETPRDVKPGSVSREFVDALEAAGAREGLIAELRKEGM